MTPIDHTSTLLDIRTVSISRIQTSIDRRSFTVLGSKLEVSVHEITGDVKKKKSSKSKDAAGATAMPMGQLTGQTDITFGRAEGSTAIALAGDRIAEGAAGGGAQSIFLNDFDFEKLGIGGLDAEFNQIFRRAFASRIWPPHIIKQMGINHVRKCDK